MNFTTRFANPAQFMKLADRLIPFLAILSALFFAAGLYQALWISPPDYQQGETVRIMYIHVPSAWIGMGLYGAMVVAAIFNLVSKHILADIFCLSAAPIGTAFVALCLISGSLWGKPTWGAYWVWDARLTSVLILFLLYCGYLSLRSAFDDDARGARASAILLLVGAVNIPIIKFSVTWWHTLHQGESLLRQGGPTIDPAMLTPLFLMALAYMFFAAFLVLIRMKTVILDRQIERKCESS